MPMQEKKKKDQDINYIKTAPEWFGCFVTEFAFGNDAQLVDKAILVALLCSSVANPYFPA